eukprot:TRINITY_DN12950_c0_g1_i6.p1 TRINITY_DN12950_c0_g1~~TRINITY_DN12950_c0_g1_i6.p1  ORF type:complete len:989 (-),score=212.71 TRINITY_DN12950_c0_g1_i6:60-3026(-)
MDKFAERQKELLQMEREAELEESAALLQGLPLRVLCQRGLALQKLWLGSQKTGLYGRTVISLINRNSVEFPAHKLSSGDIVGLIKQGDETEKPEVSGVILEVRSNSLSIAFQEDSDIVNIHEDHQFAVLKLANDVTYKRLNTALNNLTKLGSHKIADILLGQAEPSAPHQSLNPLILCSPNNDIRWQNMKLDASQRSAVEFALKQIELAIIHGPPGTGKTTTIVELIAQAVICGEKVLVCAPSNIAVDNLLQRLVALKLRCVRLGHPARISQHLHKYSLDAQINTSDQSQIVRDIYKEIDEILANVKKKKEGRGFREIKSLRKELREREKKVLKEILGNAQIILGTLASCGIDSPLKHLPEEHFSLTVIDECSQSLEMGCWMVVPWSGKLVLAGDHLQLPPTILSHKAAKELELTLMERQIDLHGDSVVRMLTTQYRMNSLIMKWSSDALYEGRVEAGSCVSSHILADLPGVEACELTQTVLLLIDTTGADMLEFSTMDGISKGNEGEASLVCAKVKELLTAGIKEDDIAIITPYNLQVETIRMNLHTQHNNIEVHSVDGFQGREKEVVILSLVRSNPNKEVGFLAEKRRLNVAVTRARRQVILICDSDTVSSDKFLAGLIEYMSENGRVETAEMYTDLPQISRPEDTTLVATSASTSATRTQSAKSEKTTKARQPKVNKKDKIQPKPKVPVENTKQSEGVKSRFEPAADINEVEVKDKFTEIIESFLASKETRLDLSTELDSNERRLVHEVAENYDLLHESEGQGKGRHIVLVKKSDKVRDNSGVQSSGKKEPPKQDTEESNAEKKPQVNIALVTCCNCLKEMPKSNIELHKLRCNVNTEKSSHESTKLKATEGVKVAAKKKTKKGKPKNSNDEDFDTICEEFENMNKVCNFTGCKTKVSIIGANCAHCRVRFCLNHSMAELHGCGEAARIAARQQLFKDKQVVPGSGSIKKGLDATKRAQIQRKLDKKLENLADSRKSKAPSKSNK